MIVGLFCAAANGAALPAMIIVFGDMIDLFVNSGIADAFIKDISGFLFAQNITSEMLSENPKLLLWVLFVLYLLLTLNIPHVHSAFTHTHIYAPTYMHMHTQHKY